MVHRVRREPRPVKRVLIGRHRPDPQEEAGRKRAVDAQIKILEAVTLIRRCPVEDDVNLAGIRRAACLLDRADPGDLAADESERPQHQTPDSQQR